MSQELTCNVNAKELCRALKSMICLGQMNASTWIQASENPLEFIKFVEDHWVEIQEEFEKSIKTFAVYPRFIRQNPIVNARDGTTFTKKIGFIKMVRLLGSNGIWGLAESKNFVETLPRDFKEFYFSSVEEAKDSKLAAACTELGVDVDWVPCDDITGLRHWSSLVGITLI